MYICICNAVTERQVKACVDDGAATVDDLAFHLGVGTCCGRCRDCAAQLLDEASGEAQPAGDIPAGPLTA